MAEGSLSGCIVGSVIGGLAGAVCLALGARYFFCNGEPDEGEAAAAACVVADPRR